MQKGRFIEVDACGNPGNLMKTQGLVQEAYNCYVEALRIQRNFAIVLSSLTGLFMEAGDLNRALQYYKDAVKLKPILSNAYLNLGDVYKALGMRLEAIVCFQYALRVRPNFSMAYDTAQRGLQLDQIIFTDVAMKGEHIKSSSLADLFLDTPLCNRHTTGANILWADLPMVTLPLEKMATRVASSLCLATGVGDDMMVNK